MFYKKDMQKGGVETIKMMVVLVYVVSKYSKLVTHILIRPSLKGGLCMIAGQKNRDVVEVVSKFEIRDVCSSSLALGMGNQSNDD